MLVLTIIFALLPLSSGFTKIVLFNDGWAEINIRTFYNALTAAKESVILSAPAENESGSGKEISRSAPATDMLTDSWLLGSSDASATPLVQACEFNSCPAGSPAEGSDPSNSDLNYVNSYPVMAMRYGIQTLAPKYFQGPPNIAVASFNVGGDHCSISFSQTLTKSFSLANLGTTVLISGTVGAAAEAAKEGIAAIAFSGATGSQIGYTAPHEPYVNVYTDLSANVTQSLVASGKPPPFKYLAERQLPCRKWQYLFFNCRFQIRIVTNQ